MVNELAAKAALQTSPEFLAMRHYRLHPDHTVEVIYRLVRTTGNPTGPLAEPAFVKRWTCHTCIVPGTLGCPGIGDLAKADARLELEGRRA